MLLSVFAVKTPRARTSCTAARTWRLSLVSASPGEPASIIIPGSSTTPGSVFALGFGPQLAQVPAPRWVVHRLPSVLMTSKASNGTTACILEIRENQQPAQHSSISLQLVAYIPPTVAVSRIRAAVAFARSTALRTRPRGPQILIINTTLRASAAKY